MYGVGKYYFGLDLLPPDDPLQQIVKMNSLEFNHDIKFALDCVTSFIPKDLRDFFPALKHNTRFQDFLQLCFDS